MTNLTVDDRITIMENEKQIEKLTVLERQFINGLIHNLYAEYGFTDVNVNDMATYMETDQATVKGVLGSLVKKGVVVTEEIDTNFCKQHFIILSDKCLFLHKRWYDEKKLYE